MPKYTPPARDVRFVLDHVVGLPAYADLPGFQNATPDVVDAVLDEGGKFVAEVLFPLNHSGDQEGCTRHDDGSVTTPKGFKEAYDAFVESGWGTLSAPEEFGGQAMPHVVSTAFQEFMISSNMAFAMYPGLTHGAIAALLVKGSDEQKAKYVPNMVSGKWGGTMNLTEPQCGTDLGLIRTRAEPQGDGSYAITGTKIFISSGEHDLTENIIHLVLAKTPGAPESSKGISLFVVPKFMVEDDGSLGARNAVTCGSIEHKMGIHANSTCVMNYDGAIGWLVGEEMKGLAAMFIMMNAARLGVGLQGLAVAEVAYQNAVQYAQDRRQGRALTGPKEPSEKADPLFVHPDIRRMLMEAKALTEGLRALCLWAALQVDLEHAAATDEEKQLAADLVGLLTPVIKGYGTDKGYDIATNAQQVYGGHGYIAEWGMEQYVRDARIAMIYEGTNGVQAMDLVGRKLAQNGGRAVQALFKVVTDEVAAGKADPATADFAARLEKANGELQQATLWFLQNGMKNPDNVGAGAHSYMHLMGIVALGLMWLRMVTAATKLKAAGEGDAAFLDAKLVTARYFAERIMPEAGALRRKIEAGAEALMALPPEMFEAA
ncbi:alkylation response protein AidB-like acyl-CoA dehydrogenase [Sphingomonas sp. BE270]|jgi:alkylation response protein AidB-like acyl-CoA dehydrogenase|uniref:acyl-CoA dehydrogenase C-terminal domain-containing protein n=2 Tax=Pseudomonadota TaxID=1224 RepID=UPI0010F5196B|nr:MULTISPECIES: acyl-CoA dehydrogenase C-terminal domain-containing protein [unclassified Sphingomonas]MDR6850195.1 alkylation response protein AidB-like acyl-CoA dehydrogenase [Sphingomonas sp. BE137]MDR7257129.1 alkylation response protein AidB-like acyl-CoA dehydrogenase [Sphingomonas sp. BE270]